MERDDVGSCGRRSAMLARTNPRDAEQKLCVRFGDERRRESRGNWDDWQMALFRNWDTPEPSIRSDRTPSTKTCSSAGRRRLRLDGRIAHCLAVPAVRFSANTSFAQDVGCLLLTVAKTATRVGRFHFSPASGAQSSETHLRCALFLPHPRAHRSKWSTHLSVRATHPQMNWTPPLF